MATAVSIGLLLSPLEMNAVGSSQFKDVPATHWAKSAIDTAVKKGYFKGYSDNTFRPNATITRAEFAAILSRLSKNEVKEKQVDFQDINGHWAESAIKQAVGMGFINTKDYSKFQPGKAMTRREMAKWMASGLAANDTDYQKAIEDTSTESALVPVAEFYKGGLSKTDYPYVSVALGTGLMAGYSDGTFGPGKTTTRAEAAVILSRFNLIQEKKATSFKDLNEMREVGLTGTNLTSATSHIYGINSSKEDLASFEKVIEKPFSMISNRGEMTIHRMIIADAISSSAVKNIYGQMFIDNQYNIPISSSKYEVFLEVTVVPHIDNLNNLSFANSTVNTLTNGSSFDSGSVKKYGLVNLPQVDFVDSGFFKKDVSRRFWMRGSINRGWIKETIKNGASIIVGKDRTRFYIPN